MRKLFPRNKTMKARWKIKKLILEETERNKLSSMFYP